MNGEFTLLTREQISGENKLEILKKIGVAADITDFAVLLGQHRSEKENGGSVYWTKSFRYGDTRSALANNSLSEDNRIRYSAIRPVLINSSISDFKSKRNEFGVLEVECGEYPQKVVTKEMNEYLIELLKNESSELTLTGKYYVIDRNYGDGFDLLEKSFQPFRCYECEYNSKKYVGIRARLGGNRSVTFDNGLTVKDDESVFVEVNPVKWLIDDNDNIAVSKYGLTVGIRFSKDFYWDGNFKNTEINMFMQKYLKDEIFYGISYDNESSLSNEEATDLNKEKIRKIEKFREHRVTREISDPDRIKKRVIKKNPYGFDFSEVSEEDIIKGCIESGIAPFLHGQSSEGKSARVKQLDPDLEIIYLRNATPDSLNGKSVVLNDDDLLRENLIAVLNRKVDIGEITLDNYINELKKLPKREICMHDIAPTWYKKIEEKSLEKPDKIHIVFFDEITNALPSIQGMAYNIILDREVNGIWKLPDNVRIVSAGNELNDSLAANQLAEPLFNRHAHVYIHTTVENWLQWAVTPEKDYEQLDYKNNDLEYKIHPAIVSYIAYKREDALRTPYNGVEPNADPRKWEMASKILEVTKKPEILRALIGKDITTDFVGFCNQQVITLEDVVNDNYLLDMHLDISQKWACANAMLGANEEQIYKVSEFVEQLGDEYASMVYKMWSGSNNTRKEIISDIIADNKEKEKRLIKEIEPQLRIKINDINSI